MSRHEKEKAFAELAVKRGWATPEQGMRCAMEHVQSQGRVLIDQVFIRNQIISAEQADEIWRELGGAPGFGPSARERVTAPRRPAPPRRTSVAQASSTASKGVSIPVVGMALAVVAGLCAAVVVVSLGGSGGGSLPPPRSLEPRPSATASQPPAAPVAVPLPRAPDPEPAAPPSKERDLLARAEEQFANAKSLFKQGDEIGSKSLVEEAGFQAEEARIKFMALQDLSSSPQIRDRIREVNQLNKMIHDRLKSAGGEGPAAQVRPSPAPTPAPAPAPAPSPWLNLPPVSKPAPAPPPEPTPPPPVPEAPPVDMAPLLTGFAAFLDKPESAGDLPSRLSAARDPFGRVAYAVSKMASAGEWKPSGEEATLLRAYAKRFLADPASIPHLEAVEFLAKEIELRKLNAPSAELAVSRTLLLGHLAALPAGDERPRPILERVAPILGLERVSGGWTCVEGAAIESARAGMAAPESLAAAFEQFKTLRDPGWELFQVFSSALLAVRAKGEAAIEATVLAVDSTKAIRYPACPAKDEAIKIKNALAKYKPCKWCKGTHQVPCDYGCDESGQVTKKCAVCNGSGLKPGYLHPPPCPEKIPGGKHTWSDPCPKCKGARGIPCRSCKAPFAPPAVDVLDVSPCQRCGGGGFLLAELKLPCVDCYGVGSRVALNSKRK
jgi:hypothetical protein